MAQLHHVVYRVAAAMSWTLALVSNFRYGWGRRSPWDDGHLDDVAFTPFTANLLAIAIFATISAFGQLLFMVEYIDKASLRLVVHFIIHNTCTLVWSYFFARTHYALALLVVLINIGNLMAAYFVERTAYIRPRSLWWVTHVPAIAAPLVWFVFLLFWNGAVVLQLHDSLSTLWANLVIWLYLIVPAAMLWIFQDYSYGFAAAWIALAIGFGQLFPSVFGLQWLFAFIISAILFVASGVTLSISSRNDRSGGGPSEERPLLAP